MDNPQQKLSQFALSQALQEAKETFMLRTELFEHIATEIKAKFDALVSAGFTAEQALELCKAKSI